MSVEDVVTDELRTVATDVRVPAPPAESDLVELARRDRARTRTRTLTASGLVAATVAAAVVLASQAGRPDTTPQPTHPTGLHAPLPTGAPPAIPYLIDGSLYLDGESVPGEWRDVQTVQGHTVATTAEGGADATMPPVGKPVLFENGAPTHVLDHGIGPARLSADGTKLAWVERSSPSAKLVVRNLRTSETAELVVDPKGTSIWGAAHYHVLWLGNDGTVVYGGPRGVRTWKPGSPPVNSDVGLQEVEGYPVDYTELAFSPDGTWAAWRTDRNGRTTDRRDVYDGVTLEATLNPDTRFTLALPAGTDVRQVVWESATDVLLLYSNDRPDGGPWRIIRCNVEDKRCELAPSQADP